MSSKSTPSAAVTEGYTTSIGVGSQHKNAMLKRYLLADPTITEKLIFKSNSQKAEKSHGTKAQKAYDTRKYLDQWEKQWKGQGS